MILDDNTEHLFFESEEEWFDYWLNGPLRNWSIHEIEIFLASIEVYKRWLLKDVYINPNFEEH